MASLVIDHTCSYTLLIFNSSKLIFVQNELTRQSGYRSLPKFGSVPIADIEQDSHLLCFDYYDISIIQGIVIPKLTDDTPRINFR